MRKLPIIALVVCIMTGLVGSAFAAETVVGTPTVFQAGITLSGGEFAPEIKMSNLDGTGITATLSPIAFTRNTAESPALDLGNSSTLKWKVADKCIVIDGKLTSAGNIEIFTDNMGTGASTYKYSGITSVWGNSPGNLVNASALGVNGLPMAWRVVAKPLTHYQIQQSTTLAGVEYPDRLWDPNILDKNGNPSGGAYPCWHWMEDKSSMGQSADGTTWVSTYGTADSKTYRTIRSVYGYQHAEFGWLAGGAPLYLYLGANFNAAQNGNYGTETLTIRCYTE